MIYTFWCGWEVDDDIPQEHMVESWPVEMRGWESGLGDGYSTWVGRVDASDAGGAEVIIRACYGDSGNRIRIRWEPKSHDHGWRPGDRFPE